MTQQTDYYMLVTALPHMPRTFEVDEVPISHQRLQQRLEMLSPRDAEIVDQVQRFLLWDRQPAERTEREVEQEYERLMKTISNPLARSIIAYRMDVRTITSALRRRRLGMPPPTGVGQWVKHIRKNWDRPDFRLSREHPWIASVMRHMEASEPLRAERELLLATWMRWRRLGDRFHFSFETILLYLARWEIVDRWTRLDKRLGRQRFDTLLTEAMGDYVSSHR
jgi:hypothetical protein